MMIGKTISHYKILEKLGEGGMGVVYKAQDTKLDRIVALKFLPKHLLCDEEAKTRFEHEAKAASALNHPNITTIHEIDEAEGECYICMEYIEGKSIKEMIKQKMFSIEEILNISIQTAEGLNVAHKKGIVHRDIKSDNIMLTEEGLVKIMDFGLAKLKGVSKLTKTGTTLGTMQYMSPEQAQGIEVDQRSDIFSFGVVLYEMITSQLPFKGEHEAAIIYSIINETPEPLARYKANVPEGLQRIVDKAMEKNRDERYQHVDEMMADLKYLKKRLETTTPIQERRKPKRLMKVPIYVYVSVTILIAILILSKLYFFASREVPINSIAVLPFQNLSADPEQEYFSDGITEALISELSKIKALRVISRTSVMRFKKTEKSLPEIAHDLNVDAVVEGSVQRVQDDVRITAQLIKAEPEKHLWASDFTKKFKDILILQSEVAQAIAREIKITVTPEEQQQLATYRTVNPEAHELYLKGMYFVNKFSPPDVEKGFKYFEEAIHKDPNYALAYTGMAKGYDYLVSITMPPKEAWPKVDSLARKALSLDKTLADAYLLIAEVKAVYEWDWKGAEEYYKRAIELNPNHATAHAWYAMYLLAMKRLDEALREAKHAKELDPLSFDINWMMSYVFLYTGQYDSAITLAKEVLKLDSTFVLAYNILGESYLLKKMYNEAIPQFRKSIALGFRYSLSSLAHAYAETGKETEAQKILNDLLEESKRRYVDPFDFAVVYFALGEQDKAIEYLEKAYEYRSVMLPYIRTFPEWEDYSKDPRVVALLKKMGLEE
jgi:serine/threonine protein kinase/Tfp pilus assembly protein PilF